MTFYVSTGLLALFGVKMLYEGWNMSSDEGREEFDEVSEELRKREEVVGVACFSGRGFLLICAFLMPSIICESECNS